ncbi:hypothetical protein BBM43_18325 [Vibrio parahaemolyticus]|uniref:Putative membrane protein n=4 Tax=Vibrio parahaemolyticus TaxID=670 RepID=A0A5P1PNU4_VIBPH|nr:hypothetical protein [Vibrio parahaemolyticus]ODZ58673.1 hypothetical protein BBM43_18325 [Vibrio parahaemolyticus]QEQ70602.1 putative membrane protein [Vibrio parahaemolyticus]QOS20156.1 hypothetical protein VP319_00014 [Vibrio parahaemolyticus]QOS22207.1 hypothetical protein VP198_00014 [Vibrio parahaemolyticus]
MLRKNINRISCVKLSGFLFVFGITINTFKTGTYDFLLYGYIITLFTSFFLLFKFKYIKRSSILFFLFLLFVCFIYPLVFVQSIPNELSFKYLFMLSPLLFIPFYFDNEELGRVMVKYINIYSLLSVSLFFFGIGVDYGYGAPRMQGFLSEPSAWGGFASVLLLSGVYYRSYFNIALFTLLIALTMSPMTMLVCLFSLLIYTITRLPNILRFLTYGLILFTVAVSIYSLLTISFDNIPLRRLSEGVLYIVTLGEQGYNPRFEVMMNMVNFLIEREHIYFGYGVNQSWFFEQEMNSISSFNLWMEWLFSFGLIGLIGYGLVSLFILFKRYGNPHIKILLISFYSYTLLNSAQGITIQIIFYVFLIVSILESYINLNRGNEFEVKE